MALNPATLQTFAQNTLGSPQQQSQTYQPYQPAPVQPVNYQSTTYQPPKLPDATAPLTSEQGRLAGLMQHPTQNPAYTAYSDSVQQAGAAAKENAQEHLQGAADPFAVQKALQSYDFQTQGLLANFLGNQFTQNSQALTSLAGQQASAIGQQNQLGQQAGQFGANLAQQGQEFGANLAEHQNEFGQQLGQQSAQFGAQLGTTQQSNLANQDLNQQRINAQSAQYLQSAAQQQGQFNAARSGPSGDAMAKSALGAILGGTAGGAGGAIGTALGSAVNNILGNPTPGRVSDASGVTGTTPYSGTPNQVAADQSSNDWYQAVNAMPVGSIGNVVPAGSPLQLPDVASSGGLGAINPTTNAVDASQNFDLSSFFDDGGGWFDGW